LITTLRFLPLFGSEFNIVRQAQVARGMQTSIHPSKLMRTLKYTFFPLLVSGLAKVDALAISMEGRGFGIYKRRTFLKPIELKSGDVIICVFALTFTAIVLTIGP
jgi:energy-coupling factor transport system permease protein